MSRESFEESIVNQARDIRLSSVADDEAKYAEDRSNQYLYSMELPSTGTAADKFKGYMQPYWRLTKRNNDHLAVVRGFLGAKTDPTDTKDMRFGSSSQAVTRFVQLPLDSPNKGRMLVAEVTLTQALTTSDLTEVARLRVRDMPMGTDLTTATASDLKTPDTAGEFATFPVVLMPNGDVHESIVGFALEGFEEGMTTTMGKHSKKWGFSMYKADPDRAHMYDKMMEHVGDLEDALSLMLDAAADPSLNPHLHKAPETVDQTS